MRILLANPRGFCAGVIRAVDIVERLLAHHGAPVYVRHALVHNKKVVDELTARGVVFVKELDEVPDGSVVVFSAHGVSQLQHSRVKTGKWKHFDATCPLVSKVHNEVQRAGEQGKDCILIGHSGHPEVEGTLGNYRSDQGRIYLVEDAAMAQSIEINQPDQVIWNTQTTLSMNDTREILEILRKRFPKMTGPKVDDICYATQNRQRAVSGFVDTLDALIVVGSTTSSNSTRLKEMATRAGCPGYLIDDPKKIAGLSLQAKVLGMTAGASTPESLFQEVLAALRKKYPSSIAEEVVGIEENVQFNLPITVRNLV